VLRVAVAQMADAVQLDVAEGAAFEGAVQACERRLAEVARACAAVAGAANRDVVTLEDAAGAFDVLRPKVHLGQLKAIAEQWSTPYTVGVREFPVEEGAAPVPSAGAGEAASGEEERRPAGPHFPALPQAHTYKRTKLDADVRGVDRSKEAELRRAAQARRALVRESLSKMRQEVASAASKAAGVAAVAPPPAGSTPLAPLELGDFERAVGAPSSSQSSQPAPP